MYGPIASSYGHPDAVEARAAARDAALDEVIADMTARANAAGRNLERGDVKWADALLGDYGSDIAGTDEQTRILLMCAAGHPGAHAAAQAMFRRLCIAWCDAHVDAILGAAERCAQDSHGDARIEAYIDAEAA